MRRTTSGLLIASWACALYAAADGPDAIKYPVGYRQWQHVKSSIVGPQSASFGRNGGMHHFYANERAVEGYRSAGAFPDGSILVDERLEVREEKGNTLEGTRISVAVMVKDATRFRDTGGWGFEVFTGENTSAGVLTAERRNTCFGCHEKATHDSVYSAIRP